MKVLHLKIFEHVFTHLVLKILSFQKYCLKYFESVLFATVQYI